MRLISETVSIEKEREGDTRSRRRSPVEEEEEGGGGDILWTGIV